MLYYKLANWPDFSQWMSMIQLEKVCLLQHSLSTHVQHEKICCSIPQTCSLAGCCHVLCKPMDTHAGCTIRYCCDFCQCAAKAWFLIGCGLNLGYQLQEISYLCFVVSMYISRAVYIQI